MFCKRCGTELADEAMFCSQCGAATGASQNTQAEGASPDTAGSWQADTEALGGASDAEPTAPQNASPDATVAIQDAPNASPDAEQKKKRTMLIVGIIVAVLVVVGGIVGYVVWDQQQKAAEQARLAQEKWDQEHKTYTSLVSLVIPEYDESSATPVPVVVNGTDFEGNPVTEYFALTPSQNSVDLMRGTYTLKIASSPVNANGGIYSYQDTEIPLEITENTEPTEVGAYEFALIPIEEVTDEQIAAVQDALQQIGFSADEATKRCDAVRQARQARLDQIAAEKAEAERKAAEEAARRANPASVNGAGTAATLKGTVVREEMPRSVTNMGWSAVVYFLVFDSPVQVTYQGGPSGVTTETLTRVQIGNTEQYEADADKNLGSITIPKWQPYVGQYIAVTGPILDAGTAHYHAPAIRDGVISEVF